jgi:hypothetical protein
MLRRFAAAIPRSGVKAERLVLRRTTHAGGSRLKSQCVTFPSPVSPMEQEHKRTATTLIKSVAILQLKVLLGAARDLALSPIALVAAFFDLVLMSQQEPRFFGMVLRFGEKSDRWIDVWSAGRMPGETQHENVDALIARVEDVVRDPEMGARQARVLRRWAERQMKRAKRRAVAEVAARVTVTPPNPPPPPPSR